MGTETARPAWVAPIPNLLTGFRCLLALTLPLVPAWWWGPFVAAAGLSDFLDGWIARRFHAESRFGRFLDGVADKAFAASVVVTFILAGLMPWWQGLLVMTRDVVVAGIAVWCLLVGAWDGFRHMQVRWLGKATTAVAFLWFLSLWIHAAAPARIPLLLVAATASVLAAADYLRQFARLLAVRRGGAGAGAPTS